MSEAATAPERTNLLGLERAGMESFVQTLGSQPFRARQLWSWLYKRGEGRIDAMTDLAKAFRAQLIERAEVRVPEIITSHESTDGTRKWLLRADSKQAFEMVFIPEPDRGTLCISSQVGCAMDCSFCSTAQQGLIAISPRRRSSVRCGSRIASSAPPACRISAPSPTSC